MKQLYTLLFITITALGSMAQGPANWWYFGSNAGLNFTSGSPVAVTNGMLNTTEGVASISDAGGNLLFYTDGNTVYDRTHNIMTNGTGLLGNNSSTQSGVIVQMPGSTKFYYLFAANLPNGGITYSVVDITQNGGLGAVTSQKNIAVYSPSTERICAVRHCNNTDVWIISHEWGTNNFRAYLLTASGLNTTPIISAAGTVNAGNSGNAIGCLKASPDGNRLAMAMHYDGTGNTGVVELYNFNITTGVVSNAINLGSTYNYPYGVEFSPDGRYLYSNSSQPGLIFQFDLCAGNAAQILASQVQVGASSADWLGTMQLGPDKKIYVALYSTGFLGVINNPNSGGTACGYVDNAVSLGGKTSTLGLPNFVANYFSAFTPTVTGTTHCLNGNFSYTMPPPTCTGSGALQSLQWDFGDPASGAGNTSSQASPAHVFSAAGTYTVKLIVHFTCYSDTGFTTVTTVSCGATVTGTGDSICQGSCGQVSAAASGGTAPYNYVWTPNIGNGAGPFAVCPAATTLYKVVVTDAGGAIDSTVVQVVVTNNPTVSASATGVTCNGANNGTATAVASGNTPFNYVWNTTPVQSTATAGNLAPGAYTVIAADVHGCADTTSVTINEPSPLTVAATGNNGGCTGGGRVIATAAGGTGPYSYSWNTSPVQTGDTATGLAAGNYTVVVTDAHNCTASASVTISSTTGLSVTATSTNVTCNGGSNGTATVTATGGTGNYTYTWSSAPAQTTATATGLPAGNYTVTVDNNGQCSATATATITAPGALVVTATAGNNITCNGGNNGSAVAAATGGTGSYNYSWSPGGQTGSTAANLSAGLYTVVASDGNNCTATATVTLTEPAAIAIAFATVPATCGGANGSATATLNGGNNPYTYSWSTNPTQTAATATGLTGGSYSLTITDNSTCTVSATVNVPSSTAVTTSISAAANVSCNGANDGSFSMLTSGGTAPYSYGTDTFSLNQGNPIANLAPGAYTIYVADANGCRASASGVITEPGPLAVTVAKADNPTCYGYTNGTMVVSTTGGAQPYTYGWSSNPGANIDSVPGVGTGTYIVTVTDNNHCTSTQTITLTSPPALMVTVSPYPQVEITAGNVVTLTAAASESGATYLWQPGDALSCTACTTVQAAPYVTTTYIVTATNANLCTAVDSVKVIVNQPEQLYIPNAFSPNGDGNNDVFQIYVQGAFNISLAVFNRWGEKVFETENQFDGWDGTYKGQRLNPGVYIYKAKVVFFNGNIKNANGSVTLLR